MGMAVDGLRPSSAGLQRNQWCTFSFLPQQRFSLSGAGQMISVCAYPGFPQVSPVLVLPFYKESFLSAFFHLLSAYRS